MAKSPGERTELVDQPTGTVLVGSGVLKSFDATALLEPEQVGDAHELQLLRATYRDVLKSMRLNKRECQLAIAGIEIHERLERLDSNASWRRSRQEENQPPGVAVSYSDGGPLLFTRAGVRDP